MNTLLPAWDPLRILAAGGQFVEVCEWAEYEKRRMNKAQRQE
jgi:hypothetical protein